MRRVSGHVEGAVWKPILACRTAPDIVAAMRGEVARGVCAHRTKCISVQSSRWTRSSSWSRKRLATVALFLPSRLTRTYGSSEWHTAAVLVCTRTACLWVPDVVEAHGRQQRVAHRRGARPHARSCERRVTCARAFCNSYRHTAAVLEASTAATLGEFDPPEHNTPQQQHQQPLHAWSALTRSALIVSRFLSKKPPQSYVTGPA
jgi:hypothetical protein